ncbi:MAG: substrate-binding domain-containing protein [Chloroflexi bacterium]|nr:substrate-binding domain-containing protein [Chloroflexota bacterium]
MFVLILGVSSLSLACAVGRTAETPGQAAPIAAPRSDNPQLILATTTSTQDSGLLDLLIPLFGKQTGYRVKPIAVGSGQAIAMGERAEADVLLVHAPDAEQKFMQAGHGADRRLIMHNDFVLVGPPSDTAGVKGKKTAREALRGIAAAKAPFFSRADESGTHQLEKKLWKEAGLEPAGQEWYRQSGQGMGATLNVASEKNGYTLTDRATYLSTRKNLSLAILLEGDTSLLNVYHVITVNPQKSPKINVAGARAFAAFMVAPETQAAIGKFGTDRFGEPLFFPDADKNDEDIGG